MYKIKRLFNKIIKIFQYIPLLWKDEDWDYSYLLELIKFKLKRIKKQLRKENLIIEEELSEIERKIQRTLDAIEKYQGVHDYFPMEHPFSKYKVTKKRVESSVHPKYGQLYSYVDIFEDTGEEVPENHEYHKYCTRYYSRLIKYEEASWNRIWNTIRDNGQKWWD
jgi:hypothetical protein